MLAATSQNEERFPLLFHLALQIVSSNRQLPDALSRHLTAVARQALDILKNPASIKEDTLPDAIQLALDMQISNDLRALIDQAGQAAITPAAARNILKVERDIAAAG